MENKLSLSRTSRAPVTFRLLPRSMEVAICFAVFADLFEHFYLPWLTRQRTRPERSKIKIIELSD